MRHKLFLVLALLGGVLVSSVFADESLTITTYYPSPYGSYNELSANKIKVGNTTVPALAQSGMIRFENRMIQPAAAPFVEGAIYYNRIDKEFKYSDGSSWKAVGGGGGNCQWISAFSCVRGGSGPVTCPVGQSMYGINTDYDLHNCSGTFLVSIYCCDN